jgi:hypothetical protein
MQCASKLSKYDAAARASVDGYVAQSARIVLVDESAKQAAALASSRARRPDDDPLTVRSAKSSGHMDRRGTSSSTTD